MCQCTGGNLQKRRTVERKHEEGVREWIKASDPVCVKLLIIHMILIQLASLPFCFTPTPCRRQHTYLKALAPTFMLTHIHIHMQMHIHIRWYIKYNIIHIYKITASVYINGVYIHIHLSIYLSIHHRHVSSISSLIFFVLLCFCFVFLKTN